METLNDEQKEHAIAIGQAPTRGGLFAKGSAIDAVLTKLIDQRLEETVVNVPGGIPLDYLAWNFSGETKFLNDCSKEELLHVCQVLLKKITPVPSSECYSRYV